MQRDVVRLLGQLGYEVVGEAQADPQRPRAVAQRGERAVVVALAVAEPGAGAREGEAGDQRDVDGDLGELAPGPSARLEQAERRRRKLARGRER